MLATSMRRVKTQLVQSPDSLLGLVPRDLAIRGRVLRDHPQAARVPEEQVCTEQGGRDAGEAGPEARRPVNASSVTCCVTAHLCGN